MIDENEFLRYFEEEISFTSESTDTRMVSVEFFIRHILPHVEVIAIMPSLMRDPVNIFTIPKNFDETWAGNSGSRIKSPFSVVFYGIYGFSSEKKSSSVEDHPDRLYYKCQSGVSRKKRPTISKEEVIQTIREAQEDVRLKLQCQGMAAEEIGKSMSREFVKGWLVALEMILYQIVEVGTRWSHGAGATLSSVIFPPKEDSEINLYQHFMEVYDYQYEFRWYRNLFLEYSQEKSTHFRSGGINALRLQKQKIKPIMQGEVSLVGFLRTINQDIRTIKRSQRETLEGFHLCPEFLTQGYLQT